MAAAAAAAPLHHHQHHQAPSDPDYIDAHPPAQVVEPRLHFQHGEHQGKWAEYDERGVPTKNAKKKKPTKKEQESLEHEFAEAKRRYQQYLRDLAAWEQQKVDAEVALERTDKLRWAFRQVGENRAAPIALEDLRVVFQIMGWDQLSKREVDLLTKAAAEVADAQEMLDLQALRTYTAERMPVLLLEERLNASCVTDFNVEDVHSPRTWRRKFEADAAERAERKKENRKSRDSLDGRSPRGKDDGDARSPRDKKKRDEGKSPRGKSPRGAKSPRGGGGGNSPRGGGVSPRGRRNSVNGRRQSVGGSGAGGGGGGDGRRTSVGGGRRPSVSGR